MRLLAFPAPRSAAFAQSHDWPRCRIPAVLLGSIFATWGLSLWFFVRFFAYVLCTRRAKEEEEYEGI